MEKYGFDAFMQSIHEGITVVAESLYDGDIELQDDGKYRYTTNIEVGGVLLSLDAVERYG
jgi:hypothetical protein